MNRRTFIASLIGLPAAIKKLVTSKPSEPDIIRPSDFNGQANKKVWRVYDPGRLFMVSNPDGPMSPACREWLEGRVENHQFIHIHTQRAFDVELAKCQIYGTHRTNHRSPR